MGAVHVHEFMTLDGVIDDPSWTFEYGWDPKMGDRLRAVTERSKGILLGRATYEMFEPAWSTRTVEEDEGAPFFNDTAKYVVSTTLTNPTWRNTDVIGAYDPDRIRRLKDEVGDLYVSGSITLVRAMLADGLVDELHLCVYPLTRRRTTAVRRRCASHEVDVDRRRVVRQRSAVSELPVAAVTPFERQVEADGLRISGSRSATHPHYGRCRDDRRVELHVRGDIALPSDGLGSCSPADRSPSGAVGGGWKHCQR